MTTETVIHMPTQELSQDELARIGFIYFTTASKECPASVTAQGAKIALLARQSEHRIADLGDALLGSLWVDHALNAANALHKKHGNGPSTESLNLKSMRYVISADFRRAEKLTRLSDDQLMRLTTELYQSVTARSAERRDFLIKEIADGMLLKQSVLKRTH